MSAARVLGLIVVLVPATGALVMLLGHLAYRMVARHIARRLRDHADSMQTLDPLRTEPAGIRYAAGLIDPGRQR